MYVENNIGLRTDPCGDSIGEEMVMTRNHRFGLSVSSLGDMIVARVMLCNRHRFIQSGHELNMINGVRSSQIVCRSPIEGGAYSVQWPR